jgi:hypothetical protein
MVKNVHGALRAFWKEELCSPAKPEPRQETTTDDTDDTDAEKGRTRNAAMMRMIHARNEL